MLEKNLYRMLNSKNRVVLLRAKVDRIVCEVVLAQCIQFSNV